MKQCVQSCALYSQGRLCVSSCAAPLLFEGSRCVRSCSRFYSGVNASECVQQCPSNVYNETSMQCL